MGTSNHLLLYFVPWLKRSPFCRIGLHQVLIPLTQCRNVVAIWIQTFPVGEAAPQNGRRILRQLALIILPLGHPFLVLFALLGHPKQNISLGRWRWGREFITMRAPPVSLFNPLAMNWAKVVFFSLTSFKANCNASSYTKKSGWQTMVNFPLFPEFESH